MPKPLAKLKQSHISFTPVSKPPPIVQIHSPNRKSVTDLTDSFEQRASRRVTRSNSNLSTPSEQYPSRVSPERAKSLDSKMANSTPPGEIPGKSNETTPGNDSENGKLNTEGHENGLPTESASADDTRTGDNKTVIPVTLNSWKCSKA